jgi:sigma-B regulation protein RsbU (phosphoserine phosphatase)
MKSEIEMDNLQSTIENPPPFAPDLREQLDMAGRVQRNFLPARLPSSRKYRFAALFRPADWVSGDIYDAQRLDEHHVGFYLADAVGHSLPAALLTIFIKQATLMRQTFSNTYEIYPSAQVLRHLNERMIQQELAGCLFATSCYFLLNTDTMNLHWARAGHPYPILIRDGRPRSLPSRGGLLGIFENAEFEEQIVRLHPGDKVFVYSDGVEPLIGQNTGEEELCFHPEFLAICSLPIDDMLRALEDRADRYPPDPAHKDDITALALQII